MSSDGPPIFLSHSAHDPEAQEALACLRDDLEAAGFVVLVDRRIEGGDEWRRSIVEWIGRCWGAVLLLSQHALHSEWVRSEVERLMQRRARLGDEFAVIPVLMPGIRTNALKAKRWAPSGLGEIQAVRWRTGARVPPVLLRRLEPIRSVFERVSPFDDLDHRLATLVEARHREAIKRAGAGIGLVPADWEGGQNVELAFVRRLLQADHAQQASTIRLLAETGDPKLARTLYRAAAPWGWVDAEAASKLREIGRRAPADRSVRINTTRTESCDMHVRRADWRWFCGEPEGGWTEAYETEVPESARAVLRRGLGLPPDADDTAIREDLARDRTTVFFVLPPELLDVALIDKLREAFAGLGVVVCQSPAMRPEAIPPAIRDVEALDPPVDPQREAAVLEEDADVLSDLRRAEAQLF